MTAAGYVNDEPSAEPTTVPRGQVSFRVVNGGAWIHELAVLPLGSGQNIGQRRIEADNRVTSSPTDHSRASSSSRLVGRIG
jgi:hypothetical protein